MSSEISLAPPATNLNAPDNDFEQFVFAVSHDLQEPVRLILSFHDLLQSYGGDQLPEKAKQYLDYAHSNAAKLQQMMHALVDYSRVGRNADPSEWVNLESLLQNFRVAYSAELSRRNGKLEGQHLPEVLAQPTLIASLLRHLIDNAIRHTSNDALHIGFSAETHVDMMLFRFRDNGEGIYPPFRPQVFHIFKTANPRAGGIGVGLTIAKAVVEKMGGTIWLNTEIESGTEVCFTLPRTVCSMRSEAS